MNTIVTYPDGSERKVKNLGWLLRNWLGVETLGFDYHKSDRQVDGVLWAKFRDGRAYYTDFADLGVAWAFLDRPIFRSLPFVLRVGESVSRFTVGNAEWNEIFNASDRKKFLQRLNITTN